MKIKKSLHFIFLFSLLLFSQIIFAYDTLLYKSRFEERIIKSALSAKEVDFFSLYSAINPDSLAYQKYSNRLTNFYQLIDKQMTDAKSGKQKAKILFREVHSYFFNKYEENVLFNRIFEKGIYNCLTASMLYSLVLKKYNIPFEVKEKPTHIYLVGFPGTENILFETTSPGGFYVPDEKFRRDYVSTMVDMKLITQEHVNTVGIVQAFTESYYSNESITLVQLAGLQYFNEAILLYQAKDIKGAIISSIKSNMLYPCPKNLYLKTSLIAEVLVNSNFDSLNDILYLADYANSSHDVKDKKFVIGTFGSIIDNKLIKNGDNIFTTEAYSILANKIKDSVVVKDISYTYYLAMGYWQSMRGNMNEVLDYSEKAYSINQKDARLQDLIIRAIALKTENFKGKDKSIITLQHYAKKFTFLKEHKTFKLMLVFQYAYKSYGLFLANSGVEGYKYLALMEDELKSMNEKVVFNDQMIGMAYAEAGAFHYRKKEYKKAKEIILKGLKVTPGHAELEERLRIVEADLRRM